MNQSGTVLFGEFGTDFLTFYDVGIRGTIAWCRYQMVDANLFKLFEGTISPLILDTD